MLAFLASWFTPTVLFCFLNLVIATIFISSNFKTHNKKPQNENNPTQLAQAPSLLERVRSFDFSHFRAETPDPSHSEIIHQAKRDKYPTQLARAPSLLERVRSFDFSLFREETPVPFHSEVTHQAEPKNNPAELARAPSLLERVRSFKISLYGSESTDPLQPGPVREEAPMRESEAPTPARMRKSASDRLMPEAEEEEPELRRPETSGEDEAVDAKADDFINRFKQQLKLQRMDSFVRYKEMLNRGVGW